MKNKLDPRHVRRVKNMQALFAYACSRQTDLTTDINPIIEKLSDIDSLISENAPKWPIDKINKVDLSILRLAIWELLTQVSTPPKVIIDEAIEIAKEFGTESSSAFINGVIASIIKKLDINTSNEKN